MEQLHHGTETAKLFLFLFRQLILILFLILLHHGTGSGATVPATVPLATATDPMFQVEHFHGIRISNRGSFAIHL
jgi:hypothetical protein